MHSISKAIFPLLLLATTSLANLHIIAGCPLVDPANPSGPTDCNDPAVLDKTLSADSVTCEPFAKPVTTVSVIDSTSADPTYHCDLPFGITLFSDPGCKTKAPNIHHEQFVNKFSGVHASFIRGGTTNMADAEKPYAAYAIDKKCAQTVTDPTARPTTVASAAANPTKRAEAYRA